MSNSQPLSAEGDYRTAAAAIAGRYADNLLDIQALARRRGVIPVFLLQPMIFHKDVLSEREQGISDHMASLGVDMRRLYRLTYEVIRGDSRLDSVRFVDLSDTFASPALNEPLFYDYCHVNSTANSIVASRISQELKGLLPAAYWGVSPASTRDRVSG